MISTLGEPAKVEVVGDQRLEEAAGVAGCVEHDGAGGLDLTHRALPPVAAIPICLTNGSGRQASQRCTKTLMVAGPSRSQMAWSQTGSAQAANPLDSSVKASPALAAWRLAHSWPLTQILIG
jgi:hypothetical protein